VHIAGSAIPLPVGSGLRHACLRRVYRFLNGGCVNLIWKLRCRPRDRPDEGSNSLDGIRVDVRIALRHAAATCFAVRGRVMARALVESGFGFRPRAVERYPLVNPDGGIHSGTCDSSGTHGLVRFSRIRALRRTRRCAEETKLAPPMAASA